MKVCLGFTLGDTNTPFYQGQYLVDAEDIVFVSINYRLNIFGFSGAPGEPYNVGLLDQRKAIEWVYNNVAGFGGDPTRISIMGHSAGGAAVDYYSYAYREHPIIAGLISHSGTAHSFEPNTVEFSQDSFMSAASLLGCKGPTVVACMREQDFAAVLDASTNIDPLPSLALSQPVFHPTVDHVTVFDNYTAMSATGSFAKIPYLVGSTDREDGFYRIAAAAENINLTEQQWLLFNLQGFTCAAARTAFARVRAGVPVWRFRYFGDWPNLRLYPGSSSYHGTDLQMLFGGIEDIVGPDFPNSAAEEKTMRYMMRAWAAFVKRPATGLSRATNWPRYNPWKESLKGPNNVRAPRISRSRDIPDPINQSVRQLDYPLSGSSLLGNPTTPSPLGAAPSYRINYLSFRFLEHTAKHQEAAFLEAISPALLTRARPCMQIRAEPTVRTSSCTQDDLHRLSGPE
ncbi:MAG: hypothetical protein Q9215_005389 [Flavoplaca cf. flavocitrina]